ncbi:MAG: transmembrane 220 family protein [Roseibacillus sp.]
MKIAKIIFSLLFLLAMYWQFNDAEQYGNHDAWFWIFFYLAAALLTAAMVKWQQPKWLLPAIVGFCLGSALFRMQDEVGNFDFTTIVRATPVPSQMNATTQKPNEVDALLLVGIWFGVVAVLERKKGSYKGKS